MIESEFNIFCAHIFQLEKVLAPSVKKIIPRPGFSLIAVPYHDDTLLLDKYDSPPEVVAYVEAHRPGNQWEFASNGSW